MNNNLNECKNPNNKSSDNNSCPIESCLLSLPPKQFALLASFFGVILLDDLTIDQKNALGNFFLSIGQTMLTAAAQEQSLQSNNSQNDEVLQEIENLKDQISLLKNELGKQK